MKPKKERSNYDFRKMIFDFTDETEKFKVLIIIIGIIRIIAIIWALKEWAMPGLILDHLSEIKWSELFKGRSP